MRHVLSRNIFSSWRPPLVFLVTVTLGFLIIQSGGKMTDQNLYLFWLAPLVCGLGGPLMLNADSLGRALYLGLLAWFGVCLAFLVLDRFQPQFIYDDCFGGCEGPPHVYEKLLAPFSFLDVAIVGFYYLRGIVPLVFSLVVTYLVLRLIGIIRQHLFSSSKERGSRIPR
jgi:hypothetical protein